MRFVVVSGVPFFIASATVASRAASALSSSGEASPSRFAMLHAMRLLMRACKSGA
jgi:hypothetical protein